MADNNMWIIVHNPETGKCHVVHAAEFAPGGMFEGQFRGKAYDTWNQAKEYKDTLG